MIYNAPDRNDEIDQGDLIDECPVFTIPDFDADAPSSPTGKVIQKRIYVLTQTCDLANAKTNVVNVAEVYSADWLVAEGFLKAADVKGSLRSGRIWGLYFLPAYTALGLSEMIVDLRRLHTVRLDLLKTLCRAGKRPGRLQPLYREHLSKHFADSFSRIGLPKPYETL